MTDRLKSGPRYDLWKWVEQNTEAVQNTTDTEAAKLASEVMGFTVTKPNMVTARKAFGIRRREGVPHG